MKAQNRALSPRKFIAIAALLTGTRDEAATRAGVNPSTLYRWLQDPEFREELHRQRSRVISDALTVLAASVEDAATVLRAVANDTAAPAAARVMASKAILDYATGFDDRASMLERLERVERELAAARVDGRFGRPS